MGGGGGLYTATGLYGGVYCFFPFGYLGINYPSVLEREDYWLIVIKIVINSRP